MKKAAQLCVYQFFPLLFFLVLVGCSSGHLPIGPAETELASETPITPAELGQDQNPSPALRIAFAPPALGKPTGAQTSSRIRKKTIGAAGGQITIAHEKTLSRFTVPRRALSKRTRISMQAHGSGPSTIVEFGPSGLHFNRSCNLAITFSSEGVDPSTLGGYLINEDGTTTPVPFEITVRKRTITINIQVDHFSQFGGEDGEPSDTEDLSDVYDEDE